MLTELKKIIAAVIVLLLAASYYGLQNHNQFKMCGRTAVHDIFPDISPKEARLHKITVTVASEALSTAVSFSFYKRFSANDWAWVDGRQVIVGQAPQVYELEYLPSSWDHDNIIGYVLHFTQFTDVDDLSPCTSWTVSVKSENWGDLETAYDLPGLGVVKTWNNLTFGDNGRLTLFLHDKFDKSDFVVFRVRPSEGMFNLTLYFEPENPMRYTVSAGLVDKDGTFGLASDRVTGKGSLTLSNLPANNTYFIHLSVAEPDWGRGRIAVDYRITRVEPQSEPPRQVPPEFPLEQLILVVLALILFLYWLAGMKPSGPLAELDKAASKLESQVIKVARKIIRDANPVQTEPRATKSMLRLLILLFAIMSVNVDVWIDSAGFRPLYLYSPVGWLLLLTSMFIHANFLHLVGNAAYLITFGDNVEDVLRSRSRWLFVYIASGVVAGLAHAAWCYFIGGPAALITPAVGASGAISGLMGFYLVHFPQARIIVAGKQRLPSSAFLALWFITQLASSIYDSGSIAYAAHVGGFAAGLLMGLASKR